VLCLGRLQPYPQTIDLAGKACQEQIHYLINLILKLQTKEFYTLGRDNLDVSNLYRLTSYTYKALPIMDRSSTASSFSRSIDDGDKTFDNMDTCRDVSFQLDWL